MTYVDLSRRIPLVLPLVLPVPLRITWLRLFKRVHSSTSLFTPPRCIYHHPTEPLLALLTTLYLQTATTTQLTSRTRDATHLELLVWFFFSLSFLFFTTLMFILGLFGSARNSSGSNDSKIGLGFWQQVQQRRRPKDRDNASGTFFFF